MVLLVPGCRLNPSGTGVGGKPISARTAFKLTPGVACHTAAARALAVRPPLGFKPSTKGVRVMGR